MTATSLEGRVAALEAQLATMSNRINYLTSVVTKFQTLTPPTVPICAATYREQKIHAITLDGRMHVLALDVANAINALGAWPDHRGAGLSASQKLSMQFGLKTGKDIVSCPLGEIAAALGVTGPIVIGTLGTGGARRFNFITEAGVVRLGETNADLAKWIGSTLRTTLQEVNK